MRKQTRPDQAWLSFLFSQTLLSPDACKDCIIPDPVYTDRMADNRFIRRLFHSWFLVRRPMTLGVRVIVEDDKGRVLLVRHTYVKGWYLPGGGVENGETQQQAAIKEVREETGIVCADRLELLGVFWNRSASRRDHVSLFRAGNWNIERPFAPNREIAEIGFFAIDALPDTTTPGTRRRIEEVYGNVPVSDFW